MTTLTLDERERDLIERLLAESAIMRVRVKDTEGGMDFGPTLDALVAQPLLERLQGTPRIFEVSI